MIKHWRSDIFINFKTSFGSVGASCLIMVDKNVKSYQMCKFYGLEKIMGRKYFHMAR